MPKDVTAYKANQKVLETYSNKKNVILQILSHDLTRPLANIKGIAALLAKRVKPDEEKKILELIDKIRQSSEQGMNLIQDFMDEEFLATTSVELVKERVDIVERLRVIIEQYLGAVQQGQMSFQLLSSQESIFCEIDEPKFIQVFTNLISNAIKFTPDGGEIILRIEEQVEQVLLEVADNGIGIPADLQEGLFERFSKARRPGLKGEPSNGLGMSIIKSIIEWHNGKIWFESQENKGTSFFIQLPKQQL